MRKEKMNIKKISELAGVSPTTVSFVLNNREGVSDKTRKKVLQIIEEEKYTPNINSRRLSLKRSFNIAFIANDKFTVFSDLFATGILNSAVDTAARYGYNITLLPSLKNDDRTYLVSAVSQGNIDGVIFFQDIQAEVYASMVKREIPLVVIDSHQPNPPYSCVRVDYEQAAYTAVRHLVEQGHKDIAYIGLESLPNFYLYCLKGFKNALSEGGLPLQPQWMESLEFSEQYTGAVMHRMLSGDHIPTAIFCGNDLVAIGAMKEAIKMGFRVPEDVSFVAIDDIFISQYYNPALTTVHLDATEMGKKAMELLYKQISGKEETSVVQIRSNDLIIRESVANLVK